MKATLSPVIAHIVQYTISSVGATDKLTKGIKRYRRMMEFAKGAVHIAELEFGLADMMITRDEPGDWREASRLYTDILERTPYGYLRGAALAGKAELAIRKTETADISEGIERAGQAYRILKQFMGDHDFFTLKSQVVEAELRLKRSQKGDGARALFLLQKAVNDARDQVYWKARALVALAEFQTFKNLNIPIRMCQEAMVLLEERPRDYFFLKARLVESELRLRRGTTSDKKYCHPSFLKVAADSKELPSLRGRALMDAAGQAAPEKAKKLVADVMKIDGLDTYLYDKSKALLETLTGSAASRKAAPPKKSRR